MRAAPVAVALIAGFAAGMGVEWVIQRPKPVPPETPALEVRQADGSLVLERKPDQSAKPVHQIPAGATVERIVSVTVLPSAEAMHQTDGSALPAAGGPASATPCPTVRVDLTLILQPDQTRRVIASSPDGRVVGGLDVPVDVPGKPRETVWTVSALAGYDLRQHCRVLGAQISRNAGPFVFQSGFIGQTAFIGAGVRW